MIQGLSKLAVRNTLRRGKKSWITVIGVFIGIAAVVSLVSLGQGLEGAINQEFESLGANNVFVSGNIDDDALEVVRNARGVDAAAGKYSSTEQVEFSGEAQRISVQGIDLDRAPLIFNGQGWSIEEGRQLRSTDRSAAVLGPSVQDQFDNDIGIRGQMRLEGENFRVTGFMSAGDPQAQSSMIIGLERMREIYNLEDELSQIVVRVQPGFTQQEVQENIEDDLRRDRGLQEGDEDFSTSTPQDIQESLTSILGVVQGIVVGLASIALLVGGIGIMNTMYMAINERTQEIGVMKAIGASKRDIRTLFLLEAGLIGLIGGLIGVIIGIGISEIAVFLASNFSEIAIARGYDIQLISGSMIFATLLGLISGYLPSRRASNLDPAEALRYE